MTAGIHDLSLVDQAEAIARGEVTSAAVVQSAVERCRTIGSALNCVVMIDEARALEGAHAADARRTAGEPLGLLHGVPLAHKDLFYRSGRPCAGGSKIRRGFVPVETATVLSRLDSAGAIDIGSLQMSEFALSPTGYNEHYGFARNPWNPDHVPGGSSSGSGVAVSARLVAASLGSDTGGSIRHPAAMCGVTGLKPTWSRVSRANSMALSWSLDCVGPIARTARDCARLLRSIAGADSADSTASRMPVPDYESALGGDLRGLTIAVAGDYYYDHVVPDVKLALDESLRVFRELGARIIVNRAPDMDLINALMHVVMTVEAATLHREWMAKHRNDYGEQVARRISAGFDYPAVAYTTALSLRTRIAQEYVDVLMRDADLLHLPSLSGPVPSIASATGGDEETVSAIIASITHCTRGINYLGLPALAAPCGFIHDLPVSFQLVGRPFAEAQLLCAADAYQRMTDWHQRVPPGAAREGSSRSSEGSGT